MNRYTLAELLRQCDLTAAPPADMAIWDAALPIGNEVLDDTPSERIKTKFPVNLTPDEDVGGFVVTFDAVPEAITQGETIEEALAMGKEALELALSFYFEENLAVPVPLDPKLGQHVIEVSVSQLRGNHL